jgi:Holliday junction resolvase RusA-like endonuclease
MANKTSRGKRNRKAPAEPREVLVEIPMRVMPKQTKENRALWVRDRQPGQKRRVMGRRTPQDVAANAQEMILRLRQYLPSGGPLTGPLLARIVVYEPFPKRRPTGASKALVWPRGTKPDCDNLSKQVCDVLEAAGFFAVGDGQIFSLSVQKYFVDAEPSVLIWLAEWPGGIEGCAHAMERQLAWGPQLAGERR